MTRVVSLDALHPSARAALAPFVEEATSSLPLTVWETTRTVEQQRDLYARGVTQIQTFGPHVRAAAVDLILSKRFADSHSVGHGRWDLGLDKGRRIVERPEVWAVWAGLARIVRRHSGIEWGGSWQWRGRLIGWDPYHTEWIGWRDLPIG